jgi:hypothetical protein
MHGDVDLARQQVLLDLLGEQALAADLLQRAVLDLSSPVVLMTTISNASSGRSKAAISRARVSWAWASASGEPRVPIFSGASGEGSRQGHGFFNASICLTMLPFA